jgi:hypothetical protein
MARSLNTSGCDLCSAPSNTAMLFVEHRMTWIKHAVTCQYQKKKHIKNVAMLAKNFGRGLYGCVREWGIYPTTGNLNENI